MPARRIKSFVASGLDNKFFIGRVVHAVSFRRNNDLGTFLAQSVYRVFNFGGGGFGVSCFHKFKKSFQFFAESKRNVSNVAYGFCTGGFETAAH